uniref:Nucleophosmin n=1 Tax=Denticeps clupeoides TaxID=299321 RepID=A0AAY4A1N8_9TELE
MEMEQMGPQTFLYGCELKSGKEVVFNPEDDDLEHQLSIRMVCVDPSTKDEMHIIEAEGRDTEGQEVQAVIASLKPSTLPSVCLGGFEITPPVVFRLKSGSGPVYISGQHLVMGADQSFDDDEDEEEEEPKLSLKRPAPTGKNDDDEDDDDDDDEEEDEESEEESPVKPKKAPSKPQTPAQNGKTHKAGTPAANQAKTPEPKKQGGAKKPQTPKTPQTPLTLPEIKAKLMATVEKGVTLPKLQPKFENYMKNAFKVTDTKIIEEMWKWRQAVKEKK